MSRKSHKVSVDDPEDTQKNFNQDQVNDQTSLLIPLLGRDISINCICRVPRSEYGSIALLNRSFRDLIRTGQVYWLRREMGIVEHWIYFSCNLLLWEGFDPVSGLSVHLPPMVTSDCFMCSDKESLAVGTELLVLGKDVTAPIVYKYSIVTNEWTVGASLNFPRCLFGSASLGGIGIVAGGCDPRGKVLSVAELYNSDTGKWEILPNMHYARKMCSAVFIHGKFYVVGGVGDDLKPIPCSEEFDLKTKEWRKVPDMAPPPNEVDENARPTNVVEAPPLLGVVNNVLYAADHHKRELKTYVKERNLWITLGGLPKGSASMHGWGIAFRACGDRLMVIGGQNIYGGRMVEISSWIPDGGSPQWDLLARRESSNFVYNCTVMGC
ncbi:hypothetical protein RJT34_33405 [Clitoria ternatea]|uniref:Uncharacterized protein n=1 Tax=Clitoria ternatea TaxID=43366 RepID=A0AAN9EY45_CLITE